MFPRNVSLCNFLKILMVSDKMIHKAFRTHTTRKTKPISEIFAFSLIIQRCQPSRFRRILLRANDYSTVLRQLNICYGRGKDA